MELAAAIVGMGPLLFWVYVLSAQNKLLRSRVVELETVIAIARYGTEEDTLVSG